MSKITRNLILVFSFISLMFATQYSVSASTDSLNILFENSTLASIVATKIGIGVGDSVTQTQLESVTDLDIENEGITSLSGIEHLTNLNRLVLNTNPITDFTPLTLLPNLQELHAKSMEIQDVSVFSTLTTLNYLNLSTNSISNIDALTTLPSLTTLFLDRNRIISLPDLNQFANLEVLTLFNQTYSFEEVAYNTSVSVSNIVTANNGDTVPIDAQYISDNGAYNTTTNSLSWTLESYINQVSFTWIYEFNIPLNIETIQFSGLATLPFRDFFTVTYISPYHSTNIVTISATNPLLDEYVITHDDYDFLGWYTDSSLTTLWDNETLVPHDITLYAKWSANTPGPGPGGEVLPPAGVSSSTLIIGLLLLITGMSITIISRKYREQ